MAEKIRRILLFILIGSWFIPALWTVFFPVAFLLFGFKDACKTCKFLMFFILTGDVDKAIVKAENE